MLSERPFQSIGYLILPRFACRWTPTPKINFYEGPGVAPEAARGDVSVPRPLLTTVSGSPLPRPF